MSPRKRRDRDEREVTHVELGGELAELVLDALEHALVVVDEVHLVHAQHEVRHAEQRREERVPARLLDHAVPGIDEDEGQVRGGRAGDHVARVLNVAGRVGDDELALRGREVAVGDVDGDALLALGAQAVGQEREVHLFLAAQPRRVLERVERVFEDLLRVVEQPPDERALAVVDGTGRSEPQQLH